MRSLPLLAVAASLAVLALASPASAATTASVANGTLNVVGDNAGDTITVGSLTPTSLFVDANGDGATDFTFPLSDITAIAIATGGGDDTVQLTQFGGLFDTTRPTTIDGGDGNDKIFGVDGNETIVGGAGDDFIDGNRGNDSISGGAGDDTIQWDPGDGSDSVDGDAGNDTLLFNGSNAAEMFTFAPNGSRVLMHRDVANVTQDLDTVERVKLLELGANDTTSAAPGLGSLVLDVDGGSGNDTFNGSDEPDVFTGGTEDDTLNGGGGNDTLMGNEGVDTINGGDGADSIHGGDGTDTLHGNGDDDQVRGDAGDDQLFGDAGTDDLDGGDGADVIHCGGAGDTVAIDVNDLISGDCVPFPAPPVPPTAPNPAPTAAPTTSGAGGGATAQPSPPTPAAPPAAVVPDGSLAAGTRGFSNPKIKAAGTSLKISLANTAGQPIHVSVAATEKVGHRTLRLGSATATLDAGQARTLTLRASAAARRALRGRRTRHPVITVRNVDTGGALTLKPHVG
jgi:Ca2+-binding RTX toxin-like protein